MSLFVVSIVCSVALSILSTQLIDTYLVDRIAILGEFFGFQLSHNPGIAFGITMPTALQNTLIVLALIVVGWMGWREVRLSSPLEVTPSKLTAVGYGLILGGGLGNVFDRMGDGLVTDFIQVGSFPIFNVADSCVTVGVVCLLLVLLGERSKGSEGSRG